MSLNCTSLRDTGATPQPDNDVSGIGILIASNFSAWITLLIAFISYWCGYTDSEVLSSVDTVVHRRRSAQTNNHTGSHRARRLLMDLILAFSDQQIITGCAVLIAGFAGLRNSSRISVYHFHIVVYLAWMASNVHLSALTMLSKYFSTRRSLLNWRLLGMTALVIGLLVALVPTASYGWAMPHASPDEALKGPTPGATGQPVGWGVPAICYFNPFAGIINVNGLLAMAMLLVGYLWKLAALSSRCRRVWRCHVRRSLEYRVAKSLQKQASTFVRTTGSAVKPNRSASTVRFFTKLSLYIWLFTVFEQLSSFAMSLFVSATGLIFGTVQIFAVCNQNHYWAQPEDQWGFGQIIPIVMLVQPLGIIFQNRKTEPKSRHASSAPPESVLKTNVPPATNPVTTPVPTTAPLSSSGMGTSAVPDPERNAGLESTLQPPAAAVLAHKSAGPEEHTTRQAATPVCGDQTYRKLLEFFAYLNLDELRQSTDSMPKHQITMTHWEYYRFLVFALEALLLYFTILVIVFSRQDTTSALFILWPLFHSDLGWFLRYVRVPDSP
ncbi:hypothetical protein K461DRAFT_181300 [Myriangium duriaei CBS 260.36]|uniref:Uncharacterized protein n=1 Tax=Myriangium duriaei CBS 260.36 TaxID=1168546 RepID=A0A9P4J1L2_9PEZI|nr:hypothetical protein K461DRAFT_181300 [Myriangium duriaei CBS 260.36]